MTLGQSRELRARGRRSWLRTLVRVGAVAVAVALLLLAMAHLPAVRGRIASLAVRLLDQQYGIQARIGRLDYNLFALRFTVSDLILASGARPAEPFLRADRVGVALGWPALFGALRVDDLHITNPRVSLVSDARGTFNLPSSWAGARTSGAPMELDLRHATVTGLSIAFADTTQAVSLDLRDLSVAIIGRSSALAGEVRATQPGTLQVGTHLLPLAQVDGHLSFDGTRLRLDPLRIRSTVGQLALHAVAGPFDGDVPISVVLNGHVDASAVARQLGQPIAGRADLSATISGTLAAPRASVRIASERLVYASLTPATVATELTATRQAIRLDRLELNAAWGRLRGRGRIGLGALGASELHLAWEDADAGALLNAVAAVPVPLRSAIAGEAHASWHGSEAADLAARIVTRALPGHGIGLPLEGTATLEIARGRWSLVHEHRAAMIAVYGTNAGRFDARAPRRSTLGGSLRIETVSVRDALAALRRSGFQVAQAIGGEVDGLAGVNATLDGSLDAPRVAGAIEGRNWRYGPVAAVSLDGNFVADPSGLSVPRATVHLPSGVLEGENLSVSRAGAIEGRATFTGTNIEPLLAAAPPWARVSSRTVTVHGTLAGTLRAPRADGVLVAQQVRAAGQGLDRVEADVSGTPSRVVLRRFEAHQGARRLFADGEYEVPTRTYRLQAHGRGLFVHSCGPTDGCSVALPLTAVIDATLDAAGVIDRPSGNVSVAMRDVRWNQYLPGPIDARASLVNGVAVVEGRLPALALRFDAVAALPNRTARLAVRGDHTSLAAVLTAAGLPAWAARVRGAFSPDIEVSIPATGVSGASVVLHLPPTEVGLDQLAFRLPRGVHVDVSPGALHLRDFAVSWGSSQLTASGSLTSAVTAGGLHGILDADAADVLSIARASGVDAAIDVTGRLVATVDATGTPSAPAVTAELAVRDGAGSWRGRRVSGVGARLALRDGSLDLSHLSATAEGLALSARGRAPATWLADLVPAVPPSWFAEPRGTPASAAMTGELSGSPSALLQSLAPPDVIGDGELAVRWTLGAAEPRFSTMRGSITVERAALVLSGFRLTQATPAHIAVDGLRASLEEWRLTGDGTDLRLSGTVGLQGARPSFELGATGTIDVAPARVFTGTPVRGVLDVRAEADGTFDQPRMRGTLDLRDGVFSAPGLHLTAIDVAGHARFEGDHAVVERLGGIVNGSAVSASGEVALVGSADRAHVLRLATTRLPLQLLGGARAEVDADLTFTATATERRLSGRVDVTPEPFRGSVSVIKQLLALQRAGQVAALQPITPVGPPLRFDVAIVTRDNLVVDSSFGRVELAADLRLAGTLDQPLLKGSARILQDGVLRAGGKTYRVIRGAIDFSNPRRIEPSLDVIAETQIGDYRIRMILTGPTDSLQTSLSSDPPLPEADLRSLLVTGRLPNDRTDRGRTVGQQEVVQALSGDLFGIAASVVGLDSVSIGTPDMDLISGNIDARTAVNIRKAVSRQVELLLSQDLEGDTFSWMFIYKPARTVQIRLLSRETNDGALEFRQELRLARPRVTPGTAPGQGRRAQQESGRRTRPRITAVTFTGSPGVPTEDLDRALTLHAGDHFDAWTWRRETDRLEEFYRLRTRYSAQVRPHRATAPDGGGVALAYDIVPGPLTVLRVDGYNFPDAALQAMRRAWSETLSTPFLLEDLERAARAELVADGYIQARVTASMPRADATLVTVILNVVPGPRSRARTIEFSGNAAISSSRLRATVKDAGIELAAWQNPEPLVVLVEELYKAVGYLDVRVHTDVPAVADGEALLPVRISEGRQYTLARIDVSGARLRETADVRSAAGVPDGAPYLSTVADTVRKNIQSSYLNQAFDDADVRVATAVERDRAAVVLAVTVDEGRRRVVDSVRIEGTERTRTKVVSDAVKLREGMPLGPAQVSTAQKRVYDTGAFGSVEIVREPSGTPAAREGDEPVVATVRVREAPRYVLRYGVQLNRRLDATSTEDVYSVGAGVDFRDRNLFGRAISAGAGVQFDTVSQSARALLGTPTTFGTAVRSNLFASYTHEREEQTADYSFFDTEASFTGEQRLRLRRHIETSWAFAFDYRKLTLASVTRATEALAVEGWTAGPRTAIVWDTRNDPFNATRGFFLSSGLDLGIRALGSEIDYSRLLVQQFVFLPAGRVVFASGVRAGTLHTYGRDNLLSLDVRFKAGGSRSVRGYAEDSLSSESFLGVPLGGTQLLVLNQEIRFPIYRWFKGVGFVDGGGTYSTVSEVGIFKVGTGVGLRLATPFALVRIDFAYPVDPRPEDKPRVYFSIGQAF